MKKTLLAVLSVLALGGVLSFTACKTCSKACPEKKNTGAKKETVLPEPTRITEIAGPVEDVGEIQITGNLKNPVVKFAAGELRKFLKQSMGKDVPIGKEIDPAKFNLVLGDTPEAKEAGLDLTRLPEEGYYIRRAGNALYIAGNDSSDVDPAGNGYNTYYRRATLSGVYDFLERFAGVRFFFPGKYGTIVPVRKGLALPETIDIMESPDMLVRNLYYGSKCAPYDPAIPMKDLHCQTYLRLRLSETRVYFGHGLAFLNLVERFGKSHPEYFALRDDGTRYNDPHMAFPSQLCFTSGVTEEIYQDIKAYFTGQPAASRGMKRWHVNTATGNFFCVMPQDSMYWCRCEKCRAISEPNDVFQPKGRQAISNHMFKFTADLANRMKKDGIKGYLTQMVYLPYDMIPECDIPDNVYLQVAVNGTDKEVPGQRKSNQQILDWNKKTGRKVSVWTYAMGKHMTKNIPGIPAMMPKETARFLQNYREGLNGAFYEAETDRFIFNYLNYYVLAKMMWNSSQDIEKLLDDHYQVMFGKGAPFVRQVFEEMEECWVDKIVNNTVMDELGPKTKVPGDRQIWTEIYSKERLKKWSDLFESARKAAAGTPEEERIVFIRKQMLEPLENELKKFWTIQSGIDSWKTYVPGSIWLRPYNGEVNEVTSRIDLSVQGDFLVLKCFFEEPRMNDIRAHAVQNDDPKLWEDSSMEFFINPSGDRTTYYHFIINSNGAVTDYSREVNKSGGNIGWNSGAVGSAVKKENGWEAELRIPLKSLGKLADAVPVNFARHRALRGERPKEIYYQWSPQPSARSGGFHVVENWGVMIFGKAPEKLIPFGDFSEISPKTGWRGFWRDKGENGGQEAGFDDRVFISGGRSIHYKNVAGGRVSGGFLVPDMKPGKKYRLSYYVKTQNIRGKDGAGAFLYFNKSKGKGFPAVRLSGTQPWHRLTFEFTAPEDTGEGREPILGLWIWFAEGEAWFDCVELIELDPAPAGK